MKPCTFRQLRIRSVCCQVNKPEILAGVKSAVEVGYRHFDTASLYSTEELLGEALNDVINSKLVSRDDVFVTTKVWYWQQCSSIRRITRILFSEKIRTLPILSYSIASYAYAQSRLVVPIKEMYAENFNFEIRINFIKKILEKNSKPFFKFSVKLTTCIIIEYSKYSK